MAQTELTQVTLKRTLVKNRESILLISDTRPGIFVYKIILPEDSPVVFSETNNNIIESELVNNTFRGKLKFVKMKLIPGVTIRDLYKKPYKIIVHTHGVNAHDQIENQRRYETSLLPESVGGFHTSISELLFFDIGSPPQLATLSNIRTEHEDVKSRFSVGSVDITPTIGLGYARFETSRNKIAGRVTQRDDIVAARNNPASLITLYNLNELKDRTVPPEITLTKIENVSSDYISYRVDYLVNAVRGLSSPAPTPGDISSDFESFVFMTDTDELNPVFFAKIKDNVSLDKYGNGDIGISVYNDQNEKYLDNVLIGRHGRDTRTLGMRGAFYHLSQMTSDYLDVEIINRSNNNTPVGRIRITPLTEETEYTDSSVSHNKKIKGVKIVRNNKTVYYRILGFPSSLKKTRIDPVYILEADDKLGIALKDPAFTSNAKNGSKNIFHIYHGNNNGASDESSRQLIRASVSPINGTYEQDYSILNISEATNQPRKIINAVTQYHIPNIGTPGALEGLRYGLVAMNTQGKGVLYAAMNEHRRTNTSHYLGFTQLPNFNDRFRENPPSVTAVGSNETGFSSTNPRSFSLAPLGISPANVNLWRDGGTNEPVLRHQMTLTNTAPNVTLLKDYNLASGSDSVSYTSYGILKVINTTSSKPAKCTIRLTKTEGNPRVEVLNAQGVSIQNTVGKLICMKPGTDGLVAVEISHGKDSNPIEVPLSHFTKKGNEDKYELLFLIKGHDANADHIIGHAAIALARNQLKEDSPDYDFGLGQILMILNKAGNGVMLKAMVPHGLLTRAEDLVLLNERKPNSVYNISMETGALYDIVTIDGVLQDTPQPGSTVLQFGIRKDGELKRGKRITLTQINPSVVSETQDNANGRVYTYDYASVNTSNRIDMKLVKKDNDIHVIFTDSTGKNVTSEVDEFTIVHNSLLSDPSWFGTFILRVSAWQLAGKFNSLTGSYQLPVNNNPHLLKVANLVGSNDKRYGVILVHRSVNDALAAIYHNAGFINTASALPTIGTETGVRYLQINNDGSGFSKVAFGNTWSDRPSSHPRTHQFNYINNQGWVSTTSADRNDLTRLNHMAGSGIYPKEIESSEGTYATFTFIYENNGQSGQDNDLRLYKDDFVPGLYMKKFSPEYTTTKHLGYAGSINNANMVPLAGIAKQSDKIGFDSDYTIRRNTLVNQAGVDDTTPDVIGKYPSRIIYVNNTRGNLDSGIRYAGDVLLSSSVIRNQNDNTKMTVSPFFNGMLPDVNQDFTEICGTANLSRDLSEWRVEATVFNALARLNMSEYPIMEITGPNLQPVSTDILRIRGPENKRPIVLNQVQNNILTTAPRVLVIENDICFDAAEGVDLDKVKLIPDNPSRPTVVIMRGRLILRHRRFVNISGIGIASSFILINETQWDLDQLFRIAVLRDKDSLDPGFDIRRVRRIELSVRDDGGLNTRMYLPKGYINPASNRSINLITPRDYTGAVTDQGGFSTGIGLTENNSANDYIYEGGTMRLFGPGKIELDKLKSFIAKDSQRGHKAPFRFIETIGGGRKIYVFLPDNTINIPPAPGNTGSTPTPATGDATIDIVSEYIHERTGSTSLSNNIVGARKFISISKKDNLYNPYDNMINESGNSLDLAVIEIAVKLPGDSNKYPIAVDKKTRHYVGDTVRYYLSGDLPEPIRRNPWADPLQVEIVTTIYRGARNGNRYEIIRSTRGRLVNWHHPQ